MKKQMFALVAAVSIAAFADTAAPALRNRPMRPSFGTGREMMGDPAVMSLLNPKVAEKVGLSAEVKQKIAAADADFRKKVTETQSRMRASMEKQSELLSADKPDEPAIMAAVDEYFDLQKEMTKARIRRTLGIKALVTPEQLEKAKAEFTAFREQRGSRRINGPKAGPRAGKPAEGAPKAEGDKPETSKPETK